MYSKQKKNQGPEMLILTKNMMHDIEYELYILHLL